MHGVLTLEGAIFLLFQTLRSVALFFHRRVITTFALSALHDNQFTRHFQHPKVMLVFYRLSRTVEVRRSGTDSLFGNYPSVLLNNFRHTTGGNRTATFTDSEAESFFHSDRSDQLDSDRGVVAGHHHFDTIAQGDGTGDVGGTEVELGTVVVEEGSVTAAFFLGQDVNLDRKSVV